MSSIKIAILGSHGLMGSALYQGLSKEFVVVGFSRSDANFDDLDETIKLLSVHKPDVVINAVGKVGGVFENLRAPVELMQGNVFSSINILRAAHLCNVPRLIQFGAACMYPLKDTGSSGESELGTGQVEQSSRTYAYAKILQHEALLAYRTQHNLVGWTTVIPTNIFGNQDWKHGQAGHFIGMMTEKIVKAKVLGDGIVEVWGDGNSIRDFISTEDLSLAVAFLIKNQLFQESTINISGYGEISVHDLTRTLMSILDYDGEAFFNEEKPSGAKRKVLDSTLMSGLGWKLNGNLQDSLKLYVASAEQHFLKTL